MNREYWDRQADHWEQEIFDSLREDLNGVIRRAMRRAAAQSSNVIDFGCGVGGYLPFLAGEFDVVHAIDWSAPCVARARKRTARLGNVTVERNTPRVLARLQGEFGCVVAANVLIHPDGRVRDRLLASIRRVVRRGATGIFVVPSLESAAYCDFVRRISAPSTAERGAAPPARNRGVGSITIDGVPTKHHGAAELTAALASAGFRAALVERVSYRWSTEGLSPPRRMRAPLPWDWLAVARAV